MKLLFQLALSLLVGAVCVWLSLRRIDPAATLAVLRDLSPWAVALYALTLAVTHLFRAWRWDYLLRPIGVRLPLSRLLPISTIGFMAILALPFRLGEFVRPYYVARGGQSRMSAVLGTVAVERAVDGVVVSLIFFAAYLASPPGAYSPVLEFSAWLSLGLFVAFTLFLACALRWPESTIRLALVLTALPRLAPHLAVRAADKLRALIRGFQALRDPGNLAPFLLQTLLYWGANGLGVWLLARQMGLDITPMAAFAAMAFTGVVISLPNSPGLVGQFHAGMLEALRAYVPAAALGSIGGAYVIALHGIQFAWYVGLGLLCLSLYGGGRSLRAVVAESKRAASALDGAAK